jgi:acetyl esterase/lipase
MNAGVRTEFHLFAGAPHGFDLVEKAPATLRALTLRGAALRRTLGASATARAA